MKQETKLAKFETLGCRLNHTETEILQRSLEQQGYRLAGDEGEVDLFVVNTCTVTEQGDAKNRQLIRSLHRRHPQASIAVIGCYAQMDGNRISKMPGVRLVLGNQEKMNLSEHLILLEKYEGNRVITPSFQRGSFETPVIPKASREDNRGKQKVIKEFRTRTSLKIQDGCDFMCSFCIIPFARGRSRYRNHENLMKEAKLLCDEGVKEIVLTGVNIGTYQENGKNLLDIIDALHRLEGPERIRISSIEPTTVPEGILERMTDSQHKLVPFLHLPVQSGSDTILQKMKRRYSVKEYAHEVHQAWKKVEDICIGTDVMVGFPGETEAQFLQTQNLLQDLPIHYFHVFPYSSRPGTPAQRLEDQLDPNQIRERAAKLRNLSRKKRRHAHRKLIGTTQQVLFESRKTDGSQSGYTANYTRVTLREDSGKDHCNQMIPVQITHLGEGLVYGSPTI
ncbi:MAG: tRNA (N(6)-L-threonylcarbamoyladenosine(37)-C(2))-methylthiotransferase MtaB [SAR324 cluster bacterium]|jgi:threonylcarbamoyladenosine tRNA methylthiotransferase MtaB|nr:tRNA (N(6)-L-threonylcarbamoyladenosine(37)-C(2))-methylthiotransferase MtaB [SAR324 cluster bacterium]